MLHVCSCQGYTCIINTTSNASIIIHIVINNIIINDIIISIIITILVDLVSILMGQFGKSSALALNSDHSVLLAGSVLNQDCSH